MQCIVGDGGGGWGTPHSMYTKLPGRLGLAINIQGPVGVHIHSLPQQSCGLADLPALFSLNTMAGSTHCCHLVAILLLLIVVRNGNGSSCSNLRLLTAKELVCTASSEEVSFLSCEKAFDGIATGDWASEIRGSAWASNGEGVGAWIKAYFNEPYQVKKVSLIQRANKDERNREVELEFSEGETKVWVLESGSQSNYIQSAFTLGTAIQTSSLKVTILDVFGTINNGWEEVKIFVC